MAESLTVSISGEKASASSEGVRLDCHGHEANELIRATISSGLPCMICRLGNNELNTVLNYLDLNEKGSSSLEKVKNIIKKKCHLGWSKKIKHKMSNNAGFFPADAIHLSRFAELMLASLKDIDILGSWLKGETRVLGYLSQARLVPLKDLEPYYHENPWSEVLEGKTVLVIHPFEESIKNQFSNRDLIFEDKRVLPDFRLVTLKAVQTCSNNGSQFTTWFDALRWMCDKVSSADFDLAIIGAGAYGLPLASHVKKLGRQAVHLGGATQILFGIRGGRWDKNPFFQSLYNEYWVRPLPSETPAGFRSVESGCYW